MSLSNESKKIYMQMVKDYFAYENIDQSRDLIEYPLPIPGIFCKEVKSKCPFCGGIEELFLSDFIPMKFHPWEKKDVEEGWSFNEQIYIERLERNKSLISNKIVICGNCLKYRRGIFPVNSKGERELLNPLNLNTKINSHFNYTDEGALFGITRKGKVSIEVYGLMRRILIDTRAEMRFIERLPGYDKSKPLDLNDDFACEQIDFLRYRFLNDELFYLESEKYFDDSIERMVNQLILRNFKSKIFKKEDNIVRDEVTHPEFGVIEHRIKDNNSAVSKKDWINNGEVYSFRKGFFSIGREKDVYGEQIKPVFINRVQIKNYKTVKDIEFNIRTEKGIKPWVTILGENGAGKTSILQAIALAMVHPEYSNQIIGSELDYEVNVFSELGDIYTFNNNNGKYPLVIGYGSTRLRDGENVESSNYPSSIKNLFDSRIGLVNSEEYLSTLSAMDFETVANVVKKIFMQPTDIYLEQKTLFFKNYDWIAKFNELSDGYGTMVALVVDIMKTIKNHYSHFDGQAIVLIDEIENHLHPNWIINLSDIFKKIFPYIQFITTSHNPLSIRNLKPFEVLRLERMDGKLTMSDIYMDQSNFSLEGVLNSNLFKLYDTNPQKNERISNLYSEIERLRLSENNKQNLLEDITKELKEEVRNFQGSTQTMNYQYYLEAKLTKEFEISGLSMKERIDSLVNKLLDGGLNE